MNDDKLQVAASDHDESQYPVSRRGFLKGLGGGIVILFTVGDPSAEGRGRKRPDFNAHLRIGEDGRVTCFTSKVELGQGPMTSLAQMLADELDVSLDSVEMVMSDTARCPNDGPTWGSTCTPQFGPVLRAAGAEARAVLIGLAAVRLNVPRDRLAVKDGVVFDKTQESRKVTYAQLTEGKKITRKLGTAPKLKTAGQFNLIGKPVNRIDAADKITGRAKYAGDIRVPGMVYARVLRPPSHGAKLKSLDASAVDGRDGCQVVRDDELVAVLHKYPDMAEKALSRLRAKVRGKAGNVETGATLAKEVVEQTYLNGYVAHATMETHTALASFEGDNLTVWASSQTPYRHAAEIARELGIDAEKVRVIVPFVGGGFGGKIANGQAIQAARLARKARKPVQLVWSRADEFFYDTFRPAAAVSIKSGVDASGKIVLWDYGIYGMGGRGAQVFYDIPHNRVTEYQRHHLLPTGAWRAPDNNTNSFARESHIDVTAARAGIDPLEFRLKNIKDPKFQKVLKTGADKFGWTPAKKIPSGRGYGMACGLDVGVPVVLFAEVKVDESTGAIQVKRVVCAQDMGLVINPEGVSLQVEGCVTMGLGYALTEEVNFTGGRVLDENFDTYTLPNFSWVPEIESVLIKADHEPAKGAGEPAIICMGGVVANAVYDATGARLKQMPMTPERVKKALAERS
ncbi:MAG: xanthine dehydrogenase family protein molybdopterin-binding subunit [Planctomycetota bacterium]|jgi:isoquinoline 1-oxidoreductase